MASRDLVLPGGVARGWIAGNPIGAPDDRLVVKEQPMPSDRIQYVRKQHVRRGRAGYRGDPRTMRVIDPDTGREAAGYVEQPPSKVRRPSLND